MASPQKMRKQKSSAKSAKICPKVNVWSFKFVRRFLAIQAGVECPSSSGGDGGGGDGDGGAETCTPPAKSPAGETSPRSPRPISATSPTSSSYPLRAESDSRPHVRLDSLHPDRVGFAGTRVVTTNTSDAACSACGEWSGGTGDGGSSSSNVRTCLVWEVRGVTRSCAEYLPSSVEKAQLARRREKCRTPTILIARFPS